MNEEEAIKIMLDAEAKLRTPEGINDPVFMSKQMMRLAQATGALEEYLAKAEKEYELEAGKLGYQYLISEDMPITKVTARVKIELAELRGDIAYMSRKVSSAWRIISTIQSRYNHLNTDYKLGRITT